MPQTRRGLRHFCFVHVCGFLFMVGGGKMLKKDDKAPPENPIFAYGYLFR